MAMNLSPPRCRSDRIRNDGEDGAWVDADAATIHGARGTYPNGQRSWSPTLYVSKRFRNHHRVLLPLILTHYMYYMVHLDVVDKPSTVIIVTKIF
jgi:hypothetical protein